MNRLGLNGLLMSVAGVVVLGASVTLGCESSSNEGTTTTPEAGTTSDTGTPPDAGDSGPNPDAAACGKLPPTGLSQVVQPKAGSAYGQGAVLTLDKKGRPLFAFLDHPPSSNQTLYVVRWDDCTGAWLPPLKVDDDILGDVSAGSRLVAISTDPSDGRIGIAYEKRQHLVSPPNVNDSRTIWVATSADDGASFTKVRVSEHKKEIAGTAAGDHHEADNPAIALGGGKTYVAYNQTEIACNGVDSCQTGTVLATGSAGTYTYDVVKDTSDVDHGATMNARSMPLGLALDSDGIPGVVAHVEPATGYNTIVAYYKPGFTTYKPVVDSNGVQNDDGAASLAYDGKKPRVVTRIQRGAIGAITEYTLLFSASDDGTTWAAPLPLPEVDNHAAASERIIASGGKVLIVAGGPRSWKSSDLTTFVGSDLQIAHGSVSVSEVLGADGKQWIGFDGTTPHVDSAEGGIVLYRE